MTLHLAVYGLIGAAICVLLLVARRATTILAAEVRDGVLNVRHENITPRVLADIRDVVRTPPVKYALIRVVRRDRRAQLDARGSLTSAQLQQLRNVIGVVPLAQLVRKR